METLRVALLGAGGIALDQHLPAWRMVPEARVVAVADPLPQARLLVEREFGIERTVADYRRLLDDPAIDCVDICVPSALHAEVAVAALAAGKHVYCEKPMATSRSQAADMLDAARAARKKLMIGQHMRFEPSVVRLRTALERCPLGDVYFARAQWLRRRRLPGKPGFTRRALSGGGALYDIGVHVLDLAWWLMGCPPPVAASGAVYSHLARRNDLGSEWGAWDPDTIDVEDFGAGQVRFANGALLGVEASWLALQPEDEFHRVQLLGTQAGIVWPENIVVGETRRVAWQEQLEPATGEKAHRAALVAFARALVDNQPVPIPPEQSATVVAMLEGIYHSGQAGREMAVEAFAPPPRL